MQKILISSVLAGLLICIPGVKAQAVGYEPFTWETTGNNYSYNYLSGGVGWTDSGLYTPAPGGATSSSLFSASAPSGVSGSGTSVGSLGNSQSVWAWIGGGSPFAYDDICVADTSVAFLASPNGTIMADYGATITTDTNTALVYDLWTASSNALYPLQDMNVVRSSGRAYISTDTWAGMGFAGISVNGTNAQVTTLGGANATFVIP